LQATLRGQGIYAVPHLSCIGTDKASLKTMLSLYRENGIKRVVVLRGDLPSGMGSNAGDFQFAYQLVAQIRQWFGDDFRIDVAAYPEFHPQSENPHMDLTHFKQKIDAGASGAITQYFYCKEAYARLLDSCAYYKIDVPIVPGIMPIQNFQKLRQFSQFCGAEIPRWLYKRLEEFGADQAGMRQYGIEVVSQLCHDLLALGAPGLHFYTLNRLEPTATICKEVFIPS
jgi:methylenetetrahydrofolate reductase (NADPH)